MCNLEAETLGVGTTPNTTMIPVKKGGISSANRSFLTLRFRLPGSSYLHESQSAAPESSPELYVCDKK